MSIVGRAGRQVIRQVGAEPRLVGGRGGGRREAAEKASATRRERWAPDMDGEPHGPGLQTNWNVGSVSCGAGLRRRRASSCYRIDQHALRSAESTDGLKTAVANPVVDGPTGHAEDLRRVVQRHAAADTRFEAAVRIAFTGRPSRRSLLRSSISARPVPSSAIAAGWQTRN